ncbi:MAG: hypothetical protein LM555_02880, partial [Desulfurococcaceae archaeon]|nr:hypothetical protein [Desulfurococcaceae archaeon]
MTSSRDEGEITTLELPFRANLVKTITTPHYLLGVYYDGKIGKAILVFLSEDGEKLVKVPDPTGHHPYFLTSEDPESLKVKLAGESSVLG